MARLFLKIYDTLCTRRWLSGVLVMAIVVVCIGLSLRIKYEEDISAFLPIDNNIKEYTQVYSEIGGQDRIAVIFSGDTDSVVSAMDMYGEILVENDSTKMVKDLQVTIDEQQALKLMEYVFKVYPLMLNDDDYNRMDSLFNIPEYIEEAITDNKQALSLPIGNILTQSLPYDPLHISSELVNSLRENSLNDHYQIIDGHIFSKDGSKGLVLLSSQYGISESKQNERLVSLLNSVGDIVSSHFSSVSISCIGAPVIAVSNASQIKKDSLLAVILSAILIFSVLYYSFRNLKDIGWIGISILFGWLFALGGLAVINDSVSIIVLGIGSIIIGIAANYPLHYLEHTRHENKEREVLKEMTPPLLIGNITTVSAFLCLVFLDAKAMCDFGIFGSLMLIGTILFVLVFLPCFMSNRCSERKVHPIIPEVKLALPPAIRKVIFPSIIVLTLFLGYYSLNTQFDSDMQHINYMTDNQRSDLKFLSSSIEANNGASSVFLVSKAACMEDVLVVNESVLKQIRTNKHIQKITGIGEFVISQKTKEKRVAQWKNFWANHRSSIETFKKEAVAQGFAEEAFRPFYELCENGVEDNLTTPFADMIGENFIRKSEDGSVQIVNILSVDKGHTENVKQDIRERAKDYETVSIYVFDNKDIGSSLVTILSDSFDYIGFVCAFVVFAFLWISFGRLELAIISFLPLAVSWLWILGIMDLWGITFNIVNIILATFIFGQGDDYSIFITEGLIYENTYGRKRLKTYRNSVALSAVLMFIGIGTLIIAKHPALYSLAEVAIIGMLAVVVMTFYLPPLIFRWLTTKHGKMREIPITFERIVYSLWTLGFFLFFSMLFFVPYALFHSFFLSKSRKCRKIFHKVLQTASRFVIYRVPGVKYKYINAVNETLDKPAMIICNHQSHLDVMCLLMMSPKIVILTNDWVWNNPLYGAIIHAAEFYPISDGIDKNLTRLKDLVGRGYSVVVFPEGTRAKGRGIMHFHQGAFSLAKELNIDILPIMLHGLYDVLPKHDFMLRRGAITLEVHERMKAADLQMLDIRELTKRWHLWYVEKYKEMSRKLEVIEYWVPYVEYSYMFKTTNVEKRCHSSISKIVNDRQSLQQYFQPDGSIVVSDCGQGELALLLALAYPDKEVYAYQFDKDLFDIASNTALRPLNLHLYNSYKVQ